MKQNKQERKTREWKKTRDKLMMTRGELGGKMGEIGDGDSRVHFSWWKNMIKNILAILGLCLSISILQSTCYPKCSVRILIEIILNVCIIFETMNIVSILCLPNHTHVCRYCLISINNILYFYSTGLAHHLLNISVGI